MALPWELFPLILQAVYVTAALPPLAKLVRQKRSDQRTLVDQWICLAAHVAMLAWAFAYAQQSGLVASTLVSIAMTLLTAGLIWRYRVHPGGKPFTRGAPAQALVADGHPLRALPL